MNTRRPLSALVVAVCIALAGHAQAEVRAVKLPTATLRELAAISLPPPPAREKRHAEERRAYGPHTSDGLAPRAEGVAAPRITTNATITAPPVVVGFPSSSSNAISPADATGAVSKTHVVAGSNMGFVIHSRTGAKLGEVSLPQFWNAGNGSLEFYDPRVAYDPVANRWIAVAIRDEFAVMLAVSASGDPTGAWFRYQIDIDGCDFTRIALTRDTVMVSTLIGNGELSNIMSFSKAELYAGANDPEIVDRYVQGDAAPVNAPDSEIEYVVFSGDAELGIRRLDTSAQRYASAGFSWIYGFDDHAPQLGGNHLSIGYSDVQSAVYRDGWIYAVHRIGASTRTSDENALVWWKADPEGVKPTEVGIIDSPAGVTYAYPSLAVNRHGGMLISFCTFTSSGFPSASYVYRDPAGRVSAPAVIRTGNAAVSGTDRWGDYTAVVEDPANGRDFWIGQIYATRRSWETWWAAVKVPAGRSRAVRH
jgi:hypothetical protein